MITSILIEAPAKINLILNIKGKRADGYHELETVMHQINLVDRIYIKKNNTGILLNSTNPAIPKDKSNLAYQAAEMLGSKYGSGEGVSIFIDKNIPVGAGLAGGSTDAAAVLKGMNLLYDYNIPDSELFHIAALLGSDVPFCLQGTPLIMKNEEVLSEKKKLGATSLARGRGEILSSLQERVLPWMILVKPDYQLSTSQVYGAFQMEKVQKVPDIEAFLKAWEIYDIIDMSHNSENVLETVSIKLYPEIMLIKKTLENLGAIKATMSGSGPSVFGIFTDQRKALKAQQIMMQRYAESYLVSSYSREG